MFDTKHYQDKMDHAFGHFEDELKKIRTGRAHPDMLSGISVEVYGQRMPLNQVANVSAPEAQQLLVTPFDPSNIGAITQSIRDDQGLGLNPSDDGRLIRVPIPALTEERRRELVKQLGEKVENARIAMRQVRQDAFKDLKRKKDAKELSENDVSRVEKEFDHNLMSEYQGKIDATFKAKEQEVMKV
ncbi:MAG: ribosome recycling factor [Patescibacteria group bacterium]